MKTPEDEHREPTSNRARASAIGIAAGAALGGALVADQVAGIDDAVVVAGIAYLVYLVSFHTVKHVSGRRRPAVAAARDADVFRAFLDALHDRS